MKGVTLTLLRKELDAIDTQLVQLLQERADLSKKIAGVKNRRGLSILQLKVWEKQLQKRRKQNKNKLISPAFLEKVFVLIHKESVRIQKQILKK